MKNISSSSPGAVFEEIRRSGPANDEIPGQARNGWGKGGEWLGKGLGMPGDGRGLLRVWGRVVKFVEK